MGNIFKEKYPEFVDSDVRKNRSGIHYQVSDQLLFDRASILLPPEFVKGKTILDLGCCVAANGAWALEHGAKRYVGVDVQSKFVETSRNNLSKYFSGHDWEILEIGFTDFFETNVEQFDVVIAAGVMYTSLWYQKFVESVARIGTVVIIDSAPPRITASPEFVNFPESEYLAVTQYWTASMIHEESKGIDMLCSFPSITVLSLLFEDLGFSLDISQNEKLRKSSSKWLYNRFRRYVAVFTKTKKVDTRVDFEFYYKNEKAQQVTGWDNNSFSPIHYQRTFSATTLDAVVENKVDQWRFSGRVAKDFVAYARKHIPDYNKVIDMSKNICVNQLSFSDKIVDVGCATGYTLSVLASAGFTNLYGVDESADMLNECRTDLGKLICSSQFPTFEGPFDAVICNWTLHFIKDKVGYVEQMFSGLSAKGFLIITDKTVNEGLDLTMYHNFKRVQGVSEEEIAAKAESLKNVMFINPVEWYLETLKGVGFRKVSVINAAPCFTTFLAFK